MAMTRLSSSFGWFLCGLLTVGIVAALSAPQSKAADDETTKTEKQTPKKEKTTKKKAEEGELQPEVEEEITTADGVKLAVTYYPGTKGKESVPVLLLHPFKGSRSDFTKDGGLAPYLQKNLGCAVIVPDLRGHGDSKTRVGTAPAKKLESGAATKKGDADAATPKKTTKKGELEAENLKKSDFPLMVTQDLLRVKNYIRKKNNQEELNINKLCVVGVDMGASVALEYALFDACGYEYGTPYFGLKKLQLGCFVKALVLISPQWSCNGFNAGNLAKGGPAGAYVRANTPVLIFVGKENATALKEAKRIEDMFKQVRKADAAKTLMVGQLDTSLQGMKTLDHAPLRVMPKMAKFLSVRVLDNPEAKKDWVWKEAELPE
jgi:pimeloyl-ACP methyl ester carboxylesterase